VRAHGRIQPLDEPIQSEVLSLPNPKALTEPLTVSLASLAELRIDELIVKLASLASLLGVAWE
jgi:hypothetical protein